MVNEPSEAILSGPERLAIAYAPRPFRTDFRWLIHFDHRLRELVLRAREPMILQLRLAWWRDALSKPADQRPKGEPLLAELADLNETLPGLAIDMVDAYEAMIDAPDSDDLLPLCSAYRALVGAEPRATLRPLTILALAKQLEQRSGRTNGLRLSWHALTGR
jgi:Squalene/phytoene synthase